jgi:uncharacterized membrane protein YvlD (DUF360 family)
MAEESSKMSAPLRLVLRWVLTIALIYLLSTFLERTFFVDGGLPAYIIIGSLLTLMNVIVRPLLHVILLPLHLIFGVLAWIIANGLFIWLIQTIAAAMDPNIVQLRIDQGVGGWILIAIILGISNWVMKVILK